LEVVRNRLATVSLAPPHARLTWTDAAAFANAFEHALIAVCGTGMDFAHRLPELLHPTDAYAIIDQHRDLDECCPGAEVDGQPARGSRDWNPIVGQALAIEFEASLRRSIPRMGLRYVAQADDYHGSVYVEMLVASSPLDLVVAQLVCDSRVAHFVGQMPSASDLEHAQVATAQATLARIIHGDVERDVQIVEKACAHRRSGHRSVLEHVRSPARRSAQCFRRDARRSRRRS
jgi:hypothetical protein